MRYKIFAFLLLMCAVQTVYASAIVGAEYFVGTDPGVGLGTALSVSGADAVAADIADIVIPVGGLPAGTYDTGVRVRDDQGRWSNALIRRFTVKTFTLAGGVDPANPNAASSFPKAVQSLVQAEYFVDADPGQGNGTPLALTGSDGLARDLVDVTIPVGSLLAGTHSVAVRVKDEAGRWSNPLIRRFTVKSFTLAGGVDPSNPNAASSFPKPAQLLTQAEYFVGADPGQGNGTPLALTGSDGLSRDLSEVTIPVGSLPAGTHNVGVRVRDEAGRWSNPLIRRFTVKSFTLAGGVDPSNPNAASSFPKPVQPLVQAEYFVGTDPGQGNGTALTLPPGGVLSQDIADVPIPLTMPPGTYNVGVRVRDEAGRWSNPLLRRFTLYRTDVLAAQRPGTKLVDLEYDLLDGPRVYTVTALISSDGGLTWTVPTGSLTGDAGNSVAPGRSKHLVWHAGEDWNNGFSEDMRFRVLAYETAQNTPPGFAPLVPGSFTMGSPVGEPGRSTDEIERSVAMPKPFFLKTTEVTWNEWNAVRNQGAAYGYTDIASGRNGLNGDGTGNHPVTDVSWVDVVKWCNLRSEIEGKKPVYYSAPSLNPATVVRTGIPTIYPFWNAGGYRLPTEAEWESACRAGAASAFSSGPITNTTADANLDPVGWYAANSGANTRPVGGKAANARGLFDMHGNVREWCWDAYAAYASGPQWSPVGGTVGAARVIRGGSWAMDAAACRSAARSSSGQNSRSTDIGFRLALNYSGQTDVSNQTGTPVDSRDPAPGNLIAGMRPGINGPVFTALSLPDGKILIGGSFTTVDGVNRSRLARLNADGTLDATFNPGADSTVFCAAILPDGRILLGGDFASVASGPADYIARINADGSLDPTFHPIVDSVVNCIAVQPDGKIVIGGDFQSAGSAVRNRVARLQADGSLDTGFDPNADGRVRALAIQLDGKILLGGAFSMVGGQGRSRLARVNVDGTIDAGFTAGADADVACIAIQESGQLLVGGAFSTLGGQTRNGLGRLSVSGVTDATFNPNVNGLVHSIAIQTDGNIRIGGEFTTVGGASRNRVAGLSPSGVLDSAFSLDFNGPIYTLNVISTGKLVVGGNFSSVNGVARQGMAWLDNSAPTETLAAMSSSRVRWFRGGAAPEASDVTFEVSTDGGNVWLPLGTGARIVGGWERTGVNLPAQGQLRARARIPAGKGNGSAALLSSTATFSGLVTIPEIAVATAAGADISDGGSFSYGTVTLGATRPATFVIRNLGYGDLTGLTITKDGANPSDFQVTTAPVAPVPGPSGATTLVVSFTPGDAGPRSAAIHIVNNDTNETPFDIQLSATAVIAGQLADAYDPAVNNRVNALAVQPDGRVIIGGTFSTVATQSRGRFARLNPDLSVESTSTFVTGSGANSTVFAVAVQPDRKILLAGQFTSINSQSRNRIARLNPDGTLEPTATFNIGTGPNNAVQAMARQPDGKIVLVGDFTAVNGQSRVRVARINGDGTLEGTATFNPGTGAVGGTVSCVAIQPDGRILIGGAFTTFNGLPRQQLARLMPDGSLDPDFTTSTDAKVSTLALQPDGKILIGGLFTTVNGAPRGGIARLLPNGQPEDITAFDPGTGADAEVTCIALQADRSILLGGAFQMMNGEVRAGIARLYPNGTLEDSITFDTVFGPDALVRGLAIRPGGSVVVGGDFTDFNGSARGRLALLANQPAQDDLSIANTLRIDWNRGGTAPEIDAVEMELSTDSGANWQALPPVARKTGGWELSGLALPSSGTIRARGRSSGGLASSSASLIEVVTPFVNAPTLVTLPATSVTINSAVLNGTVVPNGSAQVRIEYGATTAYGSATAVQTVTGGVSIPLAVPITGISGLYHFRIVAVTSGGVYYGNDLTFVTAPEPPEAVTANPISVTTATATLAGAVNPKGRATTVSFEYGSTLLYGSTTTAQILPAGNNAVDITAPITGLTANATYHCRVVAVSSGGTSYGADVSFQATTGSAATAAPSVTTGGTTGVATTGATLNGTVNPNSGFTNAFFEYGTTTSYGSVTTALGAGNGSIPVNLSAAVTSLPPGTLHHYRLVAQNSIGTTQGADATFTTNFLPPSVTTGSASALTTTSARVTGTVRARNASSAVFFDYGTDGVNFPNSVNASPANVTGDTDTAVSADLINLLQSVTYYYRVRATNDGGGSSGAPLTLQVAILSGFLQQAPGAPPAANGSLIVNLTPSGIGEGWRFVGEQLWRASGATVGALTTSDREIEFRPVAGYHQPATELVSIVSGAPATVFEGEYAEVSGTGGTGAMIIVLKPDSLTNAGLPDGQRAQWRLLGEDDSQWKESGALLDGLRPGSYLVESRSLAGRTTPRPLDVNVGEGQTVTGVATYYLADTLTGTAPSLVPFETVTGSPTLPYQYVGQFRTDAGSGSGFVVRPRVVATAAHAVFDDGTLSAATGQQWLFQRDRTSFEVKPQTPRGFYIFTGYSAQRATENTPGTSSPLSQTLDAAAVYFLEDAGRGGFSGYLASDSTPNEWLLSAAQKTLVGYPIDGVPVADQGRMHATPPANAIFTHSFGRTYTTASLRSSGGTSGGPLCVQYQNGSYYPAAIYLGGTGQTVVRVIDSELIDMFNRGETSANGGDNNTGGGITHTNSPISGSTSGKGSLKVNILPAGAASTARWKLSDSSTVLRTGGTTVANKTPGGYQVYFTSVAGYVTPTSPDSVTLSANTLTTINATYLLTQTITFPAIADKLLEDSPIALNASASSGLAVSYTVVSGPATRSGNTLTLIGYGTVTVRASQAGNSSYAAAANVTRTFDVLALTPATWTTRNFTAGEQSNAGISGHLADPEGDGICNLLEFGLNLDPKINARIQMQPDTGTSGLPAVQRNAGGNLTVEYVRRKASTAPGITYSVEFATDAAGAWTAVGTEVATSIDATFERVKVTDTIGGTRRLARLKITAP